MHVPTTVVVNAAGLGSRLGLDMPKALLEVAGRPLIAWQMELLRDVSDVRVVLGYRASDVSDVVFRVRPEAMVVLNHEFSSTGTAASLVRGCVGALGPVVSLDCDLIVHPEDLRLFTHGSSPMLGTLPVQSEEPVFVRVEPGSDGAMVARDFDRTPVPGDHEWSGLVRFDPQSPHLGPSRGHVFELIRPLLPMAAVPIRAREVDFPDEVEALSHWIEQLMREGCLS